MEDELYRLRDQLDIVDKQLVGLLEKRMAIVDRVADVKIDSGRNVYDRKRELEKIARVKELATGELNRQGAAELMELMMAISRKLQYQKLIKMGVQGKLPFIETDGIDICNARVVYQGAEGAYSEEAVRTFFGNNVNAFHVDSFRDTMSAIEDGSADYAVLPIENSTAGVVNEIYDLLSEFENYIIGEQMIHVRHCLIGVPGAEIKDIKTIYSHPQSLMQSARFLENYNWKQISMKNNAFAVKKIAEDMDITQAAIASERAAEIYGMNILLRGVNQAENNSTRFIVVSNQRIFTKDADKISICLEIAHEAGSLYRVMSHFIYNNLNMTRIESRPIEDRNWEYRFFMDFEGNLSDPSVKNALRGLREEARSLRILGNYRADRGDRDGFR